MSNYLVWPYSSCTICVNHKIISNHHLGLSSKWEVKLVLKPGLTHHFLYKMSVRVRNMIIVFHFFCWLIMLILSKKNHFNFPFLNFLWSSVVLLYIFKWTKIPIFFTEANILMCSPFILFSYFPPFQLSIILLLCNLI